MSEVLSALGLDKQRCEPQRADLDVEIESARFVKAIGGPCFKTKYFKLVGELPPSAAGAPPPTAALMQALRTNRHSFLSQGEQKPFASLARRFIEAAHLPTSRHLEVEPHRAGQSAWNEPQGDSTMSLLQRGTRERLPIYRLHRHYCVTTDEAERAEGFAYGGSEGAWPLLQAQEVEVFEFVAERGAALVHSHHMEMLRDLLGKGVDLDVEPQPWLCFVQQPVASLQVAVAEVEAEARLFSLDIAPLLAADIARAQQEAFQAKGFQVTVN